MRCFRAAALQPPENIASLIAALCHPEADRFNGEIFYVEKDRVGLFEPLEVTQDARAMVAWTIDGFTDAFKDFRAHGQAVIYEDD